MVKNNSDISLEKMVRLFSAAGAERLYFKRLSPNDNSKNQVYLGGSFEVLNVLPYSDIRPDSSSKGSKRDRFKAAISFGWLGLNGEFHKAKHAQLILYPKYPEVRLSGFLKGCPDAPSHIMATRDENRCLIIGIKRDRSILAHAVDPKKTMGRELLRLPVGEMAGVFHDLTFMLAKQNTDAALFAILKRIHMTNWINASRLRADGRRGDCAGSNCGGYTLEAELGVLPNGNAEPDYLGWEVKQHCVGDYQNITGGSPITLMTPEPDRGIYVEEGVDSFIRKFGYPDKRGRENRINFGGVYRHQCVVDSTNLKLVLRGYDAGTEKIVDVNGGLYLLTKEEKVAAGWSFSALMKIWNRKHSKAVYVPSEVRKEPRFQYRYGNLINLGRGTDFSCLLKAIGLGTVYYDPGIKLEGVGTGREKIKRRSQFRIKHSELHALYHAYELKNLLH